MITPGPESLLAAAFSGVVAVAVTRAIERWGGAVGGILGTLPTTIVPAAVGMAWAAEDPGALTRSLAIVPAGMLCNALFLATWRELPARWGTARLGPMVAASLAVWSLCGLAALAASHRLLEAGVGPSTLGLLGVAGNALLGAWICWHPGPAPAGSRPVGAAMLLARGSMAALAVGTGVWIADLGYPLVAGLASVFPAIFMTAMVGLWWSQGPSVPTGAAGPMILGGVSVSLYALLAMRTLPALGAGAGSLVAWLGAVLLWSVPSYLWLRGRARTQPRGRLTPLPAPAGAPGRPAAPGVWKRG